MNEDRQNIEESVSFPDINKFVLLFFCGYVFIWYLQIGHRIPLLGQIRFEFIYAFLLAILAFIFTPRFETARNPLLPLLLLYFAAIAIQVPFSYDYEKSSLVFVDRVLKFAAMAFFIVAFVRSPKHLKWFLAAFLLACLKMGQEGLTGRISGSLMWQNQGVMRLHGSTPLYAHPNSFAGMALGTLPFVYYLWPICNRYCKAGLGLLAVFSLNIIVFSGSRTAYLGLVVFVLYVLYSSRRKLSILLKILALLVLVSFVVPADYFDRFKTIYSLQDKEGQSIDKRIQIQKDAWEIFVHNPLGIGVAAFPKKRFDSYGRIQDTHNLYLEALTNLGIQGFLVFLYLIYKLLKLLREVSSQARAMIGSREEEPGSAGETVEDLRLIEATALATSGFIICRLALGAFGMDLYEIYWWFAIGLAISLSGMLRQVIKTSGVDTHI